jgi:hypothetical protein
MARTATDTTPREDPATGRRLRPVRSGLVAAVAFVLGLLAGAVTVGLLAEGPLVIASPEEEGIDPVPPGGGALPAEDASAEFLVSGACFGAVNAAQDTLVLVDDIGDAAAELDAARLDEIVRRLMPLQTRIERGIEACEASAVVEGRPGPGAEPTGPAEPGEDEPGEDEPGEDEPGEDEPDDEPTD